MYWISLSYTDRKTGRVRDHLHNNDNLPCWQIAGRMAIIYIKGKAKNFNRHDNKASGHCILWPSFFFNLGCFFSDVPRWFHIHSHAHTCMWIKENTTHTGFSLYRMEDISVLACTRLALLKHAGVWTCRILNLPADSAGQWLALLLRSHRDTQQDWDCWLVLPLCWILQTLLPHSFSISSILLRNTKAML